MRYRIEGLAAALVLAAPVAAARDAAEASADGERTARAAPDRPAFVISGELGWNALAGWGLQGSWRPPSRQWLALEAAGGISYAGPKAGVRARWIGDRRRVAPTFGVGLQAVRGSRWDIPEDPGFPIVPVVLGFGAPMTRATVGPTAQLQLVSGLQVRNENIDATFLVGWSHVIAGHRVRSDRPLDDDQRSWLDTVTGGGIVLSASFGCACGG